MKKEKIEVYIESIVIIALMSLSGLGIYALYLLNN